ncbi:CAP domain-containing protein [uncultured Legionella sp.]|uniref:CAP domain-containing protein n=1 Tax=uncultured Legionella sp. TaxID=210934 RepID=UPI0026298D7A|nr:CAP domain-containing protein [uncultured Legionella sp.]
MYLTKTRKLIIFFSIFLSLFQFSYADKAPNKTDGDTAIQNAILFYINEYRQQHGLTPLKMDNRIVKEAKQHSMDMATHKMGFGHKYFHQRIDRLHSQIKDSNAGAENVAYNYKDAQDVVKNWLRSPGHKRNIDGNYNLTGIGIARDKHGKIYFTQIFLKTGTGKKYATRRPFQSLFNKSLFHRNA